MSPSLRSSPATLSVPSLLLSALLGALLSALPVAASHANAAEMYTTPNFEVTAPTAVLAREVALAAEEHRSQFCQRWLDGKTADWREACQIVMTSDEKTATGWTSYQVLPQSVDELRILLKGPAPRLLEFVLPHEVAHVVLVKSLQRPLPRWADEGIALMCESEAERRRLRLKAPHPNASMQLAELLTAREYPQEYDRLHRFYAQSFLLTEFLLSRGEEQRLIRFASEGAARGWEWAACRHYGVSSLDELQDQWLLWLSTSLAVSPAKPLTHAVAARGSAGQGE